jgi:hypothetical protein
VAFVRLRGIPLLAVGALLTACGVAFSAGARLAPAPAKFQDIENSRVREEEHDLGARPPGTPTFGMSLVVGGTPLDAGQLPKPPLPLIAPL